MLIPIGDINPRRSTPIVNYLLITANVAVFVYMYLVSPSEERVISIVHTYALRPTQWDRWTTIFTSMFMHGGLLHLLGNMLFLWIAGDNVEDRLGHGVYLILYLLCGLAGAAAHVVMSLGPLSSMASVPTLGASGAISGVLGAYMVLFPLSKIRFMIVLILVNPTFLLPSWAAIGFWIASQVLMARRQLGGLERDEAAMVAVFAHLGGFALGFLWGLLVRMEGKPPPRPRRDDD